MKKKITNRVTILITALVTLTIFTIVACKKKDLEVQGYAPVYADKTEMYKIESQAPRPIVNGGKIYAFQNYTFQVEVGVGIHVIEASDLSNPTKVAFISVPGCSEISIRNNILYTNNYTDLVGIDLSNLQTAKIASRLEKTFQMIDQDAPDEQGVYFECVDKDKGMVIAWSQKKFIKPKM
ncbi:MAG: LVIVD repeat-containing protein [Bacteroidetes bacterium OLB11]|nr:MAG: LVIVD repeat-containing protein [Bacteroidetes bacterium OLB11]